MAKYKVCYSGYAYVEAGTDVEAREKYFDDQVIYEDMSVDVVVEIDEFGVEV